MGKKLEQLTRGESKEHIHFPLGSTRTRRRNWRPNKDAETPTSGAKDAAPTGARQPRRAKVDRVESIRNLFRRSRSWDSAKDLEDLPPAPRVAKAAPEASPAGGSPKSAAADDPDNVYESLKDMDREPANDRATKKGQFPYAFLRSRLTSVAEEQATAREECGDSGRGTGSHCGSISDVRTSYSETSDSKSSFSENSDTKSSCSDSDIISPIPAPTGFGDGDFVVTVRVKGSAADEGRSSVYIKPEGSRAARKLSSDLGAAPQGSEKKVGGGKGGGGRPLLTDEEKLRARTGECCQHCHCGDGPHPPIRRRPRSQPRLYARMSYPASSTSSDGLYEAIYPEDAHSKRASLDLERLDRLDRLNRIDRFERDDRGLETAYDQRRRYSRSASLDRAETTATRASDSTSSASAPSLRHRPHPPRRTHRQVRGRRLAEGFGDEGG
ncbi:hypothetical protein C7M84_008198 [Penaeus vannamei]|uniref:Uncharacterized protein n=1 Tax=Penaeus vannamei TaxID=6689 RepID=A0A423TAB4_PENVA|nr:hypothetical protein C7M84_008198 [Penaeus vannamei]